MQLSELSVFNYCGVRQRTVHHNLELTYHQQLSVTTSIYLTLNPQYFIMENGPTQGEGKDPASFLADIIGSDVTVKLNSGVVYKGTS
jgi:hypothetical protein